MDLAFTISADPGVYSQLSMHSGFRTREDGDYVVEKFSAIQKARHALDRLKVHHDFCLHHGNPETTTTK